jgi:hypothetical protein
LNRLQRHLEELPPRFAVLRDLADLEPPALIVPRDRIANLAELRNRHPPYQLLVRDLGLGVLIVAARGVSLETIALRLLVVGQHRERIVDDDLLGRAADLAAMHALDGQQQAIQLPLRHLSSSEGAALAWGKFHPPLALPFADQKVQLFHRVALDDGRSLRQAKGRAERHGDDRKELESRKHG